MTLPIRGRERELVVLSAAVEDAARGRGGVVLIEGEAGIGKSRLLQAAADVARRAGLVVASGAVDELDELAPLTSFLAALRGSTPPLVPKDYLDGVAGSADQRLSLLDRLGARLEQHALQSPILIALDDLQWADCVTLLGIRVLTAQLASFPVLWLLARRPYPTSVALDRTISQLATRDSLPMVLEALDDDDVAAIASDVVESRPDQSLLLFLEGAHGNPFFVTGLLQSIQRDGALAVDGGRAILLQPRIPAEFRDAVAMQLGALSDAARELIQLGSIFGRRFRVRDVAELLNRPTAQLAASVSEAIGADVIAEDHSDLMFRHDLLRQAVYEHIPTSVREALHHDVAHRLLARGATAADAAPHLVLAARRGDAETLELLERAADDLVPTAPGAAADIKLQILELMERGSIRWARTTSDAMRLLSISGRPRQAEELGRAAREAPPDPSANAMIQLSLGHAVNIVGLHRLVSGIVLPLLDTPELPDELQLAAISQAAAAMVRSGDEDAETMVELETELATRLASREHLINNLGNRSNLAARHGNLDNALALADEEMDLAEHGAPARSTARAPRLGLAFHLMLLDRTDEARQQLSIAERDAREVGYPWAVLYCEQARAGTRLIEGYLDDAATIAETTLEDARAVDLEFRTADLLHLLAQVAIRRGELGLARLHTDRLVTLLHEGSGLVATVRNTVGGRLALAEGEPERALRELEPVFDTPYLTTLLRNDCPLAPELVRIALAAGSHEHASRLVFAAQTYAERNPSVASITAQAAHATGLLHDDVALLLDAAEKYDRSPRLLARADIASDLANALARRNQRDEAIALLRDAFARYSELGARRDAQRTRAQLRELGIRLRTATAVDRPTTGWNALTPAEQDVARLTGEALTNRQIAERLYLSPHTVTTHLRHIFTKLEIRSRVELARLVPA